MLLISAVELWIYERALHWIATPRTSNSDAVGGSRKRVSNSRKGGIPCNGRERYLIVFGLL